MDFFVYGNNFYIFISHSDIRNIFKNSIGGNKLSKDV